MKKHEYNNPRKCRFTKKTVNFMSTKINLFTECIRISTKEILETIIKKLEIKNLEPKQNL